MTGRPTDNGNDPLKQAAKEAFDVFVEKARALTAADETSIDYTNRQELHDAYIDYVALRTAARGSRGHGRRSRFRRFMAARLIFGLVVFMPLWLAAVLIIAEKL